METIRELNKVGLDQVVKTYNLDVCRQDNLVILNYKRACKKNPARVVSECRGLVVENKAIENKIENKIDQDWKIVAKGFTRFQENKNIDSEIESIQSKEDGSLMLLYFYNQEWRVNCLHNFGNDFVASKRTTYHELFFEIVSRQTIEILDNDFLNKSFTYLFEMCSLDNRIVREYKKPKLFLLAAITIKIDIDEQKEVELNREQLDKLATLLHVGRPTMFDLDLDLNHYFSTCDPTFEGFIIVFKNGQRIKIKNSNYVLIHKLKYRDWAAATPNHILPFLTWGSKNRESKNQNLFSVLADLGSNVDEIQHLMNLYRSVPGLDKNNLIHLKHDDRYHDKNFCDFQDFQKQDDKLGTVEFISEKEYKVFCSCGSRMKLERLKKDHVVPSMCHCGKRVGIYKIDTGKIAYKCDTCDNTHEAHQFDIFDLDIKSGEPLGLPCCPTTKIYRLHVHCILDELWNSKKLTKTDAYQLLSRLLGISKNQCHVARFSIDICKRAIYSLIVHQYIKKERPSSVIVEYISI